MPNILTPNHYPVNRSWLVGWWSYRNSGSVSAYNLWRDMSGNGNDLTLNGITAISSSGAGFSRDDNSYLYITSGANLNFGINNFAISFWVCPENQTRNNPEILNDNSPASYANANYSIRYDNTGDTDKFALYSDIDMTSYLVSNSTYPHSSWYHVVIVRDSATTLKMYVNGSDDTTGGIISSSKVFDFSEMIFGKNAYDGINSYFGGFLDDIQIYNRALPAGEIKQLYLKNKRN